MPSDSAHLTAQKVPRRYGFSCTNCRRKKIRCNGEKPVCKNCSGRLRSTCFYGQPKSTELQLERAYQQVQKLQEQLDAVLSQQTADTAEKHPRSVSDVPPTICNEAESSTLEPEAHEELFWSQVSVDDQGTVRQLPISLHSSSVVKKIFYSQIIMGQRLVSMHKLRNPTLRN